jgi:hypothetical protein
LVILQVFRFLPKFKFYCGHLLLIAIERQTSLLIMMEGDGAIRIVKN